MRPIYRLMGTAALAAACLLCLNVPAHAQAPVLTVDPHDAPLHIDGVLDGSTTTFEGKVRLTAVGGDAPQVLFLASDLDQPANPAARIDRSSISAAPSPISLKQGDPTDIKVTISGARRAGDYAGALHFLLPGQPITQALAVSLTLHLQEKLDVKPVVADQKIQLVNCWPWDLGLDCWLAGLLVNAEATRDVWHVQLDNPAGVPVTVTGAAAIFRSTLNAEAVTTQVMSIDPPAVLPAGGVGTAAVHIRRDLLPADSQQGELRFAVDGMDKPVTIKSTVEVRSGPLIPLLLILAGILVGRLAKDMEQPLAKKQVHLLPQWYDLAAKIGKLNESDQDAQRSLRHELDQVKDKIDADDVAEEDAKKAVGALDERIELFRDIEDAGARATAHPPANPEAVKQLLATAYALALDPKQMTEARASLEQANKILDSSAGAAAKETTPSAAPAQVPATGRGAAETPTGHGLQAWLSQHLRLTAENRYWLVRPLLSVLLLLALTLLGLQAIYVSRPTFGSAGIFDYLALFVWGLSTDIAQSTLLGLPKKQ